jgi:RNA polymerase sigma factor (sigma-70 family)
MISASWIWLHERSFPYSRRENILEKETVRSKSGQCEPRGISGAGARRMHIAIGFINAYYTEVAEARKNISDIDILYAQCRGGDRTAENELFRQLTVRFRLFAELKIRSRPDAHDVVQTALTVIAQKYGSVEITTGFAAWAHGVIQNEILKYYRSRVYHDGLFMSAAPETEGAWMPHPEFRRRLTDCLHKIAGINPRYARILNLTYQGFEAAEMCNRLQVSTGNLYVILSRARSQLDLCLETGKVGS